MLKAVILFLILFFTFYSSALSARKISISSDKSSLSLDQEMIIQASVSGFTDEERIYLKGAFFKDGSSNYFGLTKFNDYWVKNSASVNSQKEIVIGSWDNSVIVKLDYEDSGFIGVGDYKFKLGFYYLTSSGNTSSINWSENSLDLKIENEPSPTIKLEKSGTSKLVTSEEVAKVTITPTPKKIPTISVNPAKKNTESVKISNVQKEASSYAKIKPIEETEEKENEIQVLGTKDSAIFPKFFIFSGGLLIAIAGFIYIKRELKERKII